MHNLPRIPTDPFETPQTLAVKLSGLSAVLQGVRSWSRRGKSRTWATSDCFDIADRLESEEHDRGVTA